MGNVLIVFGRNGSGKTTLLKNLAKRGDSFYCPESFNPLPSVRVRDALKLFGYEEKYLKLFGLESFWDRKFSQISSGEKKRVLLTMAFSRKVGNLLLDEPTNFLDWNYVELLVRLLKEERRRFYVAEHNLIFALAVGDEFYSVEEGRYYSKEEFRDFVNRRLKALTSHQTLLLKAL